MRNTEFEARVSDPDLGFLCNDVEQFLASRRGQLNLLTASAVKGQDVSRGGIA